MLATYGTGAIMAVPAHDARDLEFARKFNLGIRIVVQAPEGKDSIGFLDDGTSVNSGFLDGLRTPAAKQTIIAWLVEHKAGPSHSQLQIARLLFSRQRYWGEPFPVALEGPAA